MTKDETMRRTTSRYLRYEHNYVYSVFTDKMYTLTAPCKSQMYVLNNSQPEKLLGNCRSCHLRTVFKYLVSISLNGIPILCAKIC